MIYKLSLLALSVAAQGDGFGDIADNAGDFADNAGDALDDAQDEGAAIADGAVDDAAAIASDAEGDGLDAANDGIEAVKGAETDAPQGDGSDWRYWSSPHHWIGIVDCFDVVWHFIWAYFVYIKTNTSDDNVREYGDGSAGVGHDEIPINWFWDNMWHPTKGYTALGYFMTWLFYMLIALPGVIFYIWSLIEDEAAACEGISGAWLFTMWSKTAGLYGSWILYFLPVLMFILQLGQINGDIFAPGWINAQVLTAMLTISWIATGVIHVLFTPALKQQLMDKCAPKEEAPVAAEVPAEEEVVEESIEEEPTVDEGNDWD